MLLDKLAFSADTDENTSALKGERGKNATLTVIVPFVLQVYVFVALLPGCEFTDGNVGEGRSGHRR